jgi:hypothetical protein|tara:strand:- start:58 stop:234 length:177 start_codon:yes stop_codon:yes gene_type:complete
VERVQSYPTKRRQHVKAMVALQNSQRLVGKFFMALIGPAPLQARLEEAKSPTEGKVNE